MLLIWPLEDATSDTEAIFRLKGLSGETSRIKSHKFPMALYYSAFCLFFYVALTKLFFFFPKIFLFYLILFIVYPLGHTV